MKDHAKRLLRAVSFLFILALLFYGSSQLLQPKGNAREDGMHDATANGILSEPPNTLDVLFLGDSESYSSFIPLKIWQERGITSYVCGTPGQKLFYTMEFLQKAFRNQSPKLVVLETNAMFRKYSPLDAASNRLQNIFSVTTTAGKPSNPKTSSSPSTITSWKAPRAMSKHRRQRGQHQRLHGALGAKAPIPAGNVEQIRAMDAFCRERGARLIFVSVPSTINWNQKRHSAVAELARELDVTYIDMNQLPKEIPIDWNRDTADRGDHLNFHGAGKVTAYLSTYLAENGGFSDKRTWPAYRVWNDAVALFNQKTNNALGAAGSG